MVAVNTYVWTHYSLMSAVAGMAITYTRTTTHAMVYDLNFSITNLTVINSQILMNVLLTDIDVNRCVKTLRGHTCVVVEKDILRMRTTEHAPYLVEEDSQRPLDLSTVQTGLSDILVKTSSVSGR